MKRLVTMLALVLLAVASCTGGDGKGVSENSRSGDPSLEGGTLRVVIPFNIADPLSRGPSLDPQTDYWYTSWEVFRCCLLRTLLAHPGLPTEEGGSELHPDLAARMPEISGDGLTWTFHLKEGISYGPPLEDTQIVAADIIRALEREAAVASTDTYAYYYSIIEGFDAVRRGEAESISGLEAPQDSTLIVHLTSPAGNLADLFAMAATAPIPPVPSGTSGLGVAEGIVEYGRSLVASGPYMIEGSGDLDVSLPPDERAPISGYVPGRSLTLVRNPSWDPETDTLRPAYVDRMEFTLGTRIRKTVRLVEKGDADLYVFDGPSPQIPIDTVQRFLDDPELGVRVEVEPRDLIRFITMNLALPPLDDLHVRKAISYAIDKEALLDLRGGALVGDIAKHIVLDSLENGLLASYDPYPMSLTAAKAEMARSHYDRDGDGRCDHDACRDLLMLSPKGLIPQLNAMADSVRRDLSGIGIELRIETTLSMIEVNDRLANPHFKVPLVIGPAWGKDFLNASTFVAPLFSSRTIGRCCNYSLVGATPLQLRGWGYDVTSVPSVDGKIDECLALVGGVQVRCWAEADQLLMTEVIPLVPFVSENKVFLVSDRVISYSFDQFAAVPALDRIAVSADA